MLVGMKFAVSGLRCVVKAGRGNVACLRPKGGNEAWRYQGQMEILDAFVVLVRM